MGDLSTAPYKAVDELPVWSGTMDLLWMALSMQFEGIEELYSEPGAEPNQEPPITELRHLVQPFFIKYRQSRKNIFTFQEKGSEKVSLMVIIWGMYDGPEGKRGVEPSDHHQHDPVLGVSFRTANEGLHVEDVQASIGLNEAVAMQGSASELKMLHNMLKLGSVMTAATSGHIQANLDSKWRPSILVPLFPPRKFKIKEKMSSDTVLGLAMKEQMGGIRKLLRADGAPRACEVCGELKGHEQALFRCSRCQGEVRYCSRDCQAADWRGHKKSCAKKDQ